MKKRKLYNFDFQGQLGNQLFALSHMIPLCIENNITLIAPSFSKYAKFFNESASFNQFVSVNVIENRIGNILLVYMVKTARFYCFPLFVLFLKVLERFGFIIFVNLDDDWNLCKEKIVQPSKKSIVSIGWLYRDYDKILDYSELIKTVFKPNDRWFSDSKRILEKKMFDEKISVGIHIRKGDYKSFNGGKWYYADSNYKDLLRNILNTLNNNVYLIICSDEIISDDLIIEDCISKGPGFLISDLYALSFCDIVIGPPSTFSGWATWYGGGKLLHIESRQDLISREFIADYLKKCMY